MLAIKGYSNGEYVIPLSNEKIPKNRKVIITILDEEENDSFLQGNERLKIFNDICHRLKNDKEELTEEFDNILLSRFNIERGIDV